MATKRLSLPLSEADARGLDVGDIIYLDGQIYTCRSLFQIKAVEQEVLPPMDFDKLNVMLHMGGIMRQVDETWVPVSLLGTSSIRFEKLGAQIIEKLNVRAIIGKSTMGKSTMEAMKIHGCVHLAWGALIGNILAEKVVRVVDVHHLDALGPLEATWIFEVEDFGPFVVDIDTRGNNLFDRVNEHVENAFKKAYEAYDLCNFTYT
jgi:tartrate/fumarate subfamily iron-sulfur-dependent hydro-lyase beta chain